MRYLLPAFVGAVTLGTWEIWVVLANIPPFVLPAPTAIFAALLDNADTLFSALRVTLYITALAFFWAVISGIALAVVFTRARMRSSTRSSRLVTGALHRGHRFLCRMLDVMHVAQK